MGLMGIDEQGQGPGESVWQFVADEFDGIVLLVGALLVGIANLVGHLQGLENSALVAIFVAVSIRVFRVKYQLSDASNTAVVVRDLDCVIAGHGRHAGQRVVLA